MGMLLHQDVYFAPAESTAHSDYLRGFVELEALEAMSADNYVLCRHGASASVANGKV